MNKLLKSIDDELRHDNELIIKIKEELNLLKGQTMDPSRCSATSLTDSAAGSFTCAIPMAPSFGTAVYCLFLPS